MHGIDPLTGPVVLHGLYDGKDLAEPHATVSRAIDAAYDALADRRMAPTRIVAMDGTVLMDHAALQAELWELWGQTEY